MDNAPKALLIAGGMFMAILIMSLLVFAYNKIVGTSSTQQETITAMQVADFNSQFEAYNRDDVTGFELVSLINKVIDYNALNGSEGYNMTITVTLTNRQTNLFTQATYTSGTGDQVIGKKTNLTSVVASMNSLEKSSPVAMSSMVDKLTTIENKYNSNGHKWAQAIIDTFSLKNVSTDDNAYPTKSEILQYQDYLDFKRGKYTGAVHYNKNGRIDSLKYIQN